MKIKNFLNFINEELNPHTYLSAAKKLKEKGHIKRSKDLKNYGEIKPYIPKFEFDLDNLKFIFTTPNDRDKIYPYNFNFLDDFNWEKLYLNLLIKEENNNNPDPYDGRTINILIDKNKENKLYVHSCLSPLKDRRSAYILYKKINNFLIDNNIELTINVNDLYK